MEQTIQTALDLLLTSVITGGIGVIVAVINKYFKKLQDKVSAETSKINDDATKTLVENAIERLGDLILTNVASAQETVVNEIKKNSIDGYDKSDLLAVKEVVKNNILTQLSSDSKDLIATQIGDLNGYVDNKIEVVLAELKKGIV